MRVLQLLAATAVCAIVVTGATVAQATPTQATSALQAVQAMTSQNGLVTSASYVVQPTLSAGGVAPTVATSSDTVLGMPNHGSSYGILSSGDAIADMSYTGTRSTAGRYVNGTGTSVHGSAIKDLTVLKATINVPTGDNCLSLDFRFLSQEYPGFVGGNFNDGFMVELDRNDWTAVSGGYSAPGNFAFDSGGHPISINSTGALGMSGTGATGTGFASTDTASTGGGTDLLSAATPVTAGSHDIYLSIFDAFDNQYDSGALIDNLATSFVPGGCAAGATAPPAAPQAPVITAQPSATPSNTGVFTFTPASGDTSVASYECSIDGGAFAACASGDDFDPGLPDGTHSFSVRADNSGGQSGPATGPVSWTIARAATPAPTITTSPSATTTDRSADVSFTGEAGSTFECKLDGGSYVPCPSPVSYSSLSVGNHTVLVRQTDTNGNTSADASAGWQILDATPLAPVITAQPSSSVPSATGVFAFAPATGDTSAVSYECSIDGGTFAACASGDDVDPGLLDGPHTLSVRALNASSVAGPETGPESWTIARPPPAAPTVTGAPPATTNATTADVTFTGVSGATFECAIDSGPFVTCTSPASFASLAVGDHELLIHQTDLNGNTSADRTVDWTIWPQPPSAPQYLLTPVSLTVGVWAFEEVNPRSESGTITFQCSIDGEPFVACTSGSDFDPGLPDGDHTFAVRGVDAFGQPSAATGPDTWTITRPPPDPPTIVSGPDATSAATSADVVFTGGTGATFECAFDSLTYVPCTSPYSQTGLSTGDHTLLVRQTDTDGNTSSPATFSWTITAPIPLAPAITAQPSSSPSDTGIFTFAPGIGDTGTVSYQCSVDAGAFISCASGVDLDPGLLDGTHTFSVRGVNSTGQHGPAAGPVSWVIGRVPPEPPTLVSGPSTPTTSTTAVITFTGGTGATFACNADGAGYVPCTSPYSTPTLPLGPHTVLVRQTDTDGNTSAPTTVAWTIVAVPPAPTILTGPLATTISTTATFTFGGLTGSSFECKLDGASSFTACPVSFPAGLGGHTLLVRQVDTNLSTSPTTTVTWTVVVGPESPDITSQPVNFTAVGIFTFVPGAGPFVSFECSIDDGVFAACGSGTDLDPALPDGRHTLAVRAVGPTGEAGPATEPQTWAIARPDPAAPTPTIAPPATTTETTATVAFTGTPGATFTCSLDSGQFAPCTSPIVFPSLAVGAHALRVRQLDVYGHESVTATIAWQIAPIVVAVPPAIVPDAPVAPPVVTPAPPAITRPASKTFLVQVRYRIPKGCAGTCKAVATLAALVGRSGKRTLGTRSHVALPRGTFARFTIRISKAALLAAPGSTLNGIRTSRTRLAVVVTRPRGAAIITAHEGHISVSVARLESGRDPTLGTG